MEHGPFWLNFVIFTFISEKIKYFKCLCKIWNKIISFDMKEKRGNLTQAIGKMKKKVNLRVLGMGP
jgi:hypothetical protein